MKSSFKIIVKLTILIIFLLFTPFANGFKSTLQKSGNWLDSLVYHQKTIHQSISLKKQMNVLAYNANLTLPQDEIQVETTQEDGYIVPQSDPVEPKTNDEKNTVQKKVYIYNSHQAEAYADGRTVMDAAAILANKLEEKGIKVVLETNDFIAYQKEHGMDYNQSYVVSYKYLNDALVNYGGFDLCIDFHRDSVPRSSAYINVDGTSYAYAMMVIGGLGKNASSVSGTAATITDIINQKVNGIMKAPVTQQGYYNQEVHKDVVLMEVGSDTNSFEEVENSVNVIADGLYDYLESR